MTGHTGRGLLNFAAIKSYFTIRSRDFPKPKKNVLVFGSGPGATLPSDFDPRTWSLVTINASQATAARFELEPDITLIGVSMLRNQDVNKEAKRALVGRRTGALILFWGSQVPERKRFRLLRIGYSYDRVTYTHLAKRAEWNSAVTGISSTTRPSNGISAALMCFWLGAENVVLTGFSLTKQGHSYNDKNRERAHVDDDRLALRAAISRGLSLSTTQADFAEEAGLPIWRSEQITWDTAGLKGPVYSVRTSG